MADRSEQQREALVKGAYRARQRHAPEWLSGLTAARAQIEDALAPDMWSCGALDGQGNPLGDSAVKHQDGRLWKLHPLVVDPDHQGRYHPAFFASS